MYVCMLLRQLVSFNLSGSWYSLILKFLNSALLLIYFINLFLLKN